MEAVCVSEGTSARGYRWQDAGESEYMESRERATFDGIEGTGGAGRRACATSRADISTAEGTSTKVLGASVHRLSVSGVLAATQHKEMVEIVNCRGDERKGWVI